MNILRESNYTSVPWKNGGGVTREILRSPADGAEFDWRLSLATIAAPGPFSTFAGYHRTLVLVGGAGVELNFAQHGSARLSVPGQSVEFDGAWQTSCTLVDGPSTDLNLIVSSARAQSVRHAMALTDRHTVQTADWTEVFVCCVSGAIRVTNTAGEVRALRAVDVARCAPSDGAIVCAPDGSGTANVFIAAVRRRSA
ncbi:MAG: HutD family protein [Proteobacteria bacterium]|nr:HutD family protein [Pseudomonadota bacterium]